MSERVAVFVDGSNLYHGFRSYLKSLGLEPDDFNIDYKRFPLALVGLERALVDTHFYIGRVDQAQDRESYARQQRFFSALRGCSRLAVHEGRLVPRKRKHTCPHCKRCFHKSMRVEKGTDVQLAADLLVGAFYEQYDTAILVSNDTDFIPIVKQVQQLRKRVQNAELADRAPSSRLAKTCDTPLILLDQQFLEGCVFRKDGAPLNW